MQLFFDYPLFSTIFISVAIFSVSFKIGRIWGEATHDATVERTIIYLANNGYLKHRILDGKMELYKLDEQYNKK